MSSLVYIDHMALAIPPRKLPFRRGIDMNATETATAIREYVENIDIETEASETAAETAEIIASITAG